MATILVVTAAVARVLRKAKRRGEGVHLAHVLPLPRGLSREKSRQRGQIKLHVQSIRDGNKGEEKVVELKRVQVYLDAEEYVLESCVIAVVLATVTRFSRIGQHPGQARSTVKHGKKRF